MAARKLTERQERVVRLAAQGKSNPQIARAIGVKPETVCVYLYRIQAKLGLFSRAALYRWAIRTGLVSADE